MQITRTISSEDTVTQNAYKSIVHNYSLCLSADEAAFVLASAVGTRSVAACASCCCTRSARVVLGFSVGRLADAVRDKELTRLSSSFLAF